MTEQAIQYCQQCARRILEEWKGWPHKNPIPLLPKIVEGKCAICGNSAGLDNSRITWFNYHGEYNTGLPDYWLLVIDGDRTKWGKPYYGECVCPICGKPAVLSEMNYPNGKHELKSNCTRCGVNNAVNK